MGRPDPPGLDGQPIVYDFRERVDPDARAVSRPPSSSPSRCPPGGTSRCPPGEKGIRSSETNKNRIILAPQCELIMKKSLRKMDEIFVPLFFRDRISSIVHCHPHTVPAEGSGQRSRCTSGQRSRCSFGRERGWLFLSCSETTFRLLPSASCLPLSAFRPPSPVLRLRLFFKVFSPYRAFFPCAVHAVHPVTFPSWNHPISQSRVSPIGASIFSSLFTIYHSPSSVLRLRSFLSEIVIH